MKNKTNIEKSFTLGIISLVSIVLGLFISIASIHWGSKLISSVIGLSYLAAGILSLIGSVYFVKGMKEKLTIKKIVAFITNVGVLVLFIAMVIANINDLSTLYNN